MRRACARGDGSRTATRLDALHEATSSSAGGRLCAQICSRAVQSVWREGRVEIMTSRIVFSLSHLGRLDESAC